MDFEHSDKTLCDAEFYSDNEDSDSEPSDFGKEHGEMQVESGETLFEVLSTEDILQDMLNSIKHVNSIVAMPPTTTRILLNHFRWDIEKLMERFCDGDRDQLFSEARVINPFREINHFRNKLPKETPSGTEECEICFMRFLPLTGLECGHRFCSHCWCEYLTTKIMEDGIGQTIACAAHDCDILVDDTSVMRLVEDSTVRRKYQHLITNSFVECNRLLRWCTSRDCSNAIKVKYVDTHEVTCKCGQKFCFACGESWHDPVECFLLRKWIKQYDNSRTSDWITAFTKECPKCKVTIQKDGGCNRVVCKNRNCNAVFCWLCLNKWRKHGVCNSNSDRNDENDAKAASKTQKKSGSAIRFAFYGNRYRSHAESLKCEQKLYASVAEKMHKHTMSWVEGQVLTKAVDILCQCRQTLMFTYVFRYYLKTNNQSIIFARIQEDLQRAVESLSEYLGKTIVSEDLAEIISTVPDKYRYCQSRRKALLRHVHEGYEEDWWEYNE